MCIQNHIFESETSSSFNLKPYLPYYFYWPYYLGVIALSPLVLVGIVGDSIKDGELLSGDPIVSCVTPMPPCEQAQKRDTDIGERRSTSSVCTGIATGVLENSDNQMKFANVKYSDRVRSAHLPGSHRHNNVIGTAYVTCCLFNLACSRHSKTANTQPLLHFKFTTCDRLCGDFFLVAATATPRLDFTPTAFAHAVVCFT